MRSHYNPRNACTVSKEDKERMIQFGMWKSQRDDLVRIGLEGKMPIEVMARTMNIASTVIYRIRKEMQDGQVIRKR
jgi:hypothetical protein